METSNYPTSQQLLYLVCRVMWQNCQERQPEFAGFKPKYTEAYIDGKLAAIDAAEALPNEAQRALTHTTLRNDLVTLGLSGCYKWQSLKLYIESAFGAEYVVDNLNAAGWQQYSKASNEDWVALNSLMESGSQYIAAHVAELTAGNNMPPTFRAAFDAEKDAIELKYDAFIHAEEDAHIDTNEKIAADNDVYADAIDMGADGQHIYAEDEPVAKLFSFSAVSEIMKPSGTATVVVEMTDSETNQPVGGFDLTNMDTEHTVTADENGRAEMGLQAGGTRQYRVVADGYPEQMLTIEVNTGIKTIKKISVAPIISEAAKAEIEESNPIPVPVPVN